MQIKFAYGRQVTGSDRADSIEQVWHNRKSVGQKEVRREIMKTEKRRVLRHSIETTLCVLFILNLIFAGSVTGTDKQQLVSMAWFIGIDVVIVAIIQKFGR